YYSCETPDEGMRIPKSNADNSSENDSTILDANEANNCNYDDNVQDSDDVTAMTTGTGTSTNSDSVVSTNSTTSSESEIIEINEMSSKCFHMNDLNILIVVDRRGSKTELVRSVLSMLKVNSGLIISPLHNGEYNNRRFQK